MKTQRNLWRIFFNNLWRSYWKKSLAKSSKEVARETFLQSVKEFPEILSECKFNRSSKLFSILEKVHVEANLKSHLIIKNVFTPVEFILYKTIIIKQILFGSLVQLHFACPSTLEWPYKLRHFDIKKLLHLLLSSLPQNLARDGTTTDDDHTMTSLKA